MNRADITGDRSIERCQRVMQRHTVAGVIEDAILWSRAVGGWINGVGSGVSCKSCERGVYGKGDMSSEVVQSRMMDCRMKGNSADGGVGVVEA